MSKAEDLLNSLDSSDPILYTAEPETEGHIVIGKDRFIIVPESLKRIAVQHDHDIETVTFDCPRYWDGTDMSKMRVYINYMRPDGTKGSYIPEPITVDTEDPNIMHFYWTISRHVTEYKGNIIILVCVKKTNADGEIVNHWNTELNRDLYISEGMECEEAILDNYPDIITQLLERQDAVDARSSEEAIRGYVDDWLTENENTVLNAIQTKGAETLATIPKDYTAMDTEVKALRSDLTEMKNFLTLIDESTGESYRLSVINGKLTITENEEV